MGRLCKYCKKSAELHPYLSFHRFPKDSERRKVWFSILGMEDHENFSKYTEICSDHFNPSDLITTPSGTRCIKRDSVPNLNNPISPDPSCSSSDSTATAPSPTPLMSPEGPSGCDSTANDLSPSPLSPQGSLGSLQTVAIAMNIDVEPVKYVEVDINRVCRFCLGQTEVSPFFQLVTRHNLSNRNISFVEMLESHVQFKISEGDNKPQNVCNPCISQLFNAYHFFEMCALSNKILDETLRHNKNTKQVEVETIDLTDDTEKANSFVKEEDDNKYEYEIDQSDDLENLTNENFINCLFSNTDQEEISIKIENEVSPTSPEANNINFLIGEEHNYGMDGNISETVKTTKIKLEGKPKRVKTKKIKAEEKPKKRKTTPRKNFKMSERVKLSQFNCLICKVMFATFKDVIDHFDKIHEGCTRCILCDKLFRNKPTRLLKYHMNTHRRRDTRFDCRKCSQYFLTKTEMEEHYQSKEHNTDPKSCKICNRAFKKKERLRIHMFSHTQEKQIQCSKCGKCFKYVANLSRHIKVKHNGFRMLCNVCGEVFTTKLTLENHIAAIHEGDKPRQLYRLEWKRRRLELLRNKRQKSKEDQDPNLKICTFCEDVFPTVSGRRTHETVKHGYEGGVKCHRCPLVFSSVEARIAHVENVHYKHKCPFCGQGFTLEKMFKRHVALHEKPGYTKCLQCNRECKTQSALKFHMATHTGEKPYKCDKCDKAFRQVAHLRYHQFQHTRKKPYKCHLCRKVFGQDSSLQSHLNVHKGERPFACDLCDKAYAEKATLRKHIKKVHGVPDVETLRKSEGPAEKEHEETIENPKPSAIVTENSLFSLDIETVEPESV